MNKYILEKFNKIQSYNPDYLITTEIKFYFQTKFVAESLFVIENLGRSMLATNYYNIFNKNINDYEALLKSNSLDIKYDYSEVYSLNSGNYIFYDKIDFENIQERLYNYNNLL